MVICRDQVLIYPIPYSEISLLSPSSTLLVLELVEGPTLADRFKQAAIPIEESLELACIMKGIAIFRIAHILITWRSFKQIVHRKRLLVGSLR